MSRISVGAPQENPVRLTRQDWRGAQAGWTPTSVGHWEVEVKRAGEYDVTLRFHQLSKPGVLSFSLGGVKLQKEIPAGETTAVFDKVRLAQGGRVLDCGRKIGVLDAVVKYLR